jgi:hypothetical protein
MAQINSQESKMASDMSSTTTSAPLHDKVLSPGYLYVPREIQEVPLQIQKTAPSPETNKSYNKLTNKPYYLVMDKPYNLLVDKPYNLLVDKPYNFLVDKPYNFLVDKPYNLLVDKPYNLMVNEPYNQLTETAKFYNLLEETDKSPT